MRAAQLPMPVVKQEPILFGGGLDTMTPPYQMRPGALRSAQNFECSLYGGYRRIAGYERFDGHSRPSEATYAVLPCSSITGGAVGNTLTGATSAATGVIIAIEAASFIITKTVGVFQAENVKVGAGVVGVATGAAVVNGSSGLTAATYKNLAADYYRSLIAAVPGSGKVRGVWLYQDVVYAFRNNAGGSACEMYKSTAAGWSKVALGRKLLYTTGTAAIAVGATITGATSGATGVVTGATVRTGTYGGSSAAGLFTFAAVVGAFQNGENLQVAGVTKAVANGADSAITMNPDGRFEFVNANFTGSNTKKMYGVDGANPAFEFDGTTFVPIYTGMTTDTPSHIAFHLFHLFLSFGPSVQFSSTGSPYQWTPVTGAGELAMGDNVTGFQVQPAGTTAAALAVFTTGRLSILYGTGATDFQLLPYRDEIGAAPYTMQMLAQTTFLDRQGITDLATTLAFGNFTYGVISNQIKSYLATLKTISTASSVNRDLGQYRLFFSTGYAIYVAMVGKKVIGMTPVVFPNIVQCACSLNMNDGTERSFFGSDDGWVFEMDRGTSFDGVAIEAYIQLSYNFLRSPRMLKRYYRGLLEAAGTGYAAFNFGYSLGYDDAGVIQPGQESVTLGFSPVNWDEFTWDEFTWDGINLTPSVLDMEGEAENVSLAVTSISDLYEPFTLTAAMIDYAMRRPMR